MKRSIVSPKGGGGEKKQRFAEKWPASPELISNGQAVRVLREPLMTAMPHAFIGEGKRALSNMVFLERSRSARAICTSAVSASAGETLWRKPSDDFDGAERRTAPGWETIVCNLKEKTPAGIICGELLRGKRLKYIRPHRRFRL